jgi:hypothetical protein
MRERGVRQCRDDALPSPEKKPRLIPLLSFDNTGRVRAHVGNILSIIDKRSQYKRAKIRGCYKHFFLPPGFHAIQQIRIGSRQRLHLYQTLQVSI